MWPTTLLLTGLCWVRGVLLLTIGAFCHSFGFSTGFISLKAVSALALMFTSTCQGKHDMQETDWQPCAELAPAPSMLPAPWHYSSAAKFSVATPVSCNINTFIWLTCALHVLQMLQQGIRDFRYSKHHYASKQESLPRAMRTHCDHVCRSSLLHGDSWRWSRVPLNI